MEDIVDQMEVHVLIHISILKALAGETRREEKVRLYVDIESAMFVASNTLVKICLISLNLGSLSREAVHSFAGLLHGQRMKFLEGDRFE